MGSYHAPKNTPRTGCIFAHTTNPQPKPFQPTSSPPMQRNTPQCGVTKQCVAKECGAKMWRRRKMWRHQTMWRQTMWRQDVASQENVASPSNVAPNNVAPKCGATGKCGVTKQCGAKQCSAKMWRHRKMRRHQTMWRQTMWRHMSSKCVFIMCLQRQVEKCVLFCQHRESMGNLVSNDLAHFQPLDPPLCLNTLSITTYQSNPPILTQKPLHTPLSKKKTPSQPSTSPTPQPLHPSKISPKDPYLATTLTPLSGVLQKSPPQEQP